MSRLVLTLGRGCSYLWHTGVPGACIWQSHGFLQLCLAAEKYSCESGPMKYYTLCRLWWHPKFAVIAIYLVKCYIQVDPQTAKGFVEFSIHWKRIVFWFGQIWLLYARALQVWFFECAALKMCKKKAQFVFYNLSSADEKKLHTELKSVCLEHAVEVILSLWVLRQQGMYRSKAAGCNIMVGWLHSRIF